jgi:hypothetical protein
MEGLSVERDGYVVSELGVGDGTGVTESQEATPASGPMNSSPISDSGNDAIRYGNTFSIR